MTYKNIIKQYAKELKNITHIPIKEVEILLLSILDKNTIWLHLNYDKECNCQKELEKLVKKRATNYPLEYIIQKATFYGETFVVRDGVLIPRPETEILVEKAINILQTIKNPKVVEIGTGSGVISVILALFVPNIKITAVDINPKALELAKLNAKKFNVEEKITFVLSDIFTNLQSVDFDMTISNPPYISDSFVLPKNVQYEPKNALFGGIKGDELLKKIIDATVYNNIQYLLCEMGYDQKKSIEEYLSHFQPKNIEFYKDLENLDRGFVVKFFNS